MHDSALRKKIGYSMRNTLQFALDYIVKAKICTGD